MENQAAKHCHLIITLHTQGCSDRDFERLERRPILLYTREGAVKIEISTPIALHV